MRIVLIPVLMLLALVPAPSLQAAASTSEIAAETARRHRGENHLITFWWLPVEYWIAAARETGKSEAEVQSIADLFEDYTLIGALDVQFKPDGDFDALSTAEIVRRSEIHVGDVKFDPLKEVDPRLQQLVPELAYAFQVSLVELARGLHLMPLPNVGEDGKPVLSGSAPGVMRVRYRAESGEPAVEFWWHGPLTAVKGRKKCPGSGEPMEASWKFCPWNGKPAE